MTRINVVPPRQLTNKHLMAEYRELPRIFTLAKRYLTVQCDIPEHYPLGKGHMKFFVDKLHYLYLRYAEIYMELTARGYALSVPLYKQIAQDANSFRGTHLWNDYTPTVEAYCLNYIRLAKRCDIQEVHDELTSEA